MIMSWNFCCIYECSIRILLKDRPTARLPLRRAHIFDLSQAQTSPTALGIDVLSLIRPKSLSNDLTLLGLPLTIKSFRGLVDEKT